MRLNPSRIGLRIPHIGDTWLAEDAAQEAP
jgi:hypothetical protein